MKVVDKKSKTKQQSPPVAATPNPDMQIKFGCLSLAASIFQGTGASSDELIEMSERLKNYVYG